MPKALDSRRKNPRQARAVATNQAILVAAAQILEAEGEAALTTNRIAERAGVSIGSVYQYYANKEAVLAAMVMAERDAIMAMIATALSEATPGNLEDTVHRVVRAVVRAFASRRSARRIVILSVLRSNDRAFNGRMLDQVGGWIRSSIAAYPGEGIAPLTETQAYVLTRSVLGAVRAAVLEDRDIVDEPDFETELAHLALLYLRQRRPARQDRE